MNDHIFGQLHFSLIVFQFEVQGIETGLANSLGQTKKIYFLNLFFKKSIDMLNDEQ